MNNPLLQAALDYAKQGYLVFPCLPKSKAPATKDGFKSATIDPQTIENWWRLNPHYNVAIRTGQESNLTVLDIDGPEGWESAKDLGINNAEVHTPTGGGHVYYQYEPGLKNKVRFLPGLDIRSDGGYVVAAPSIHPEGGVYRALDINRSRSFPINIVNMVKQSTSQPVSEATDGEVIEGGRNHYLTKLGGSLRRLGLDEEAIAAALDSHNNSVCSPPLPDYEVATIARSVSRYEPDAIAVNGLLPSSTSPFERSGTHLVRASDLASSSLEYLADKSKVKGQPTHMEGLDKLLGGGKRLGEVTAWHAEAKTGKNTFWHYLMYLWLELGIPIGYASRELTPESEVVPNLLSLEFKENAWLSDLTDFGREENYRDKIGTWPLYFSHGYGYFPLEDIVKWVDLGVEAGIQYFWFDHLHYMLEDPEDHKTASKLIKELKTLAKLRNIHIDIIIQPNKLSDGQRLSLNSIKGGAAMGQAIDNLIILERVKQSDVKNVMKLTLEVARSKLCKPGSIYVKYNGDDTSFDEIEEDTKKTESSPIPSDPRIIAPVDAQYQSPYAGVKVFKQQL